MVEFLEVLAGQDMLAAAPLRIRHHCPDLDLLLALDTVPDLDLLLALDTVPDLDPLSALDTVPDLDLLLALDQDRA